MSRKRCKACDAWWRSQPVYHDPSEECPTERWRRKQMAKPKTKADKAERIVQGVETRINDAKKRLRTAEALLIDLEDRAARRQARDARNPRS